MHTLMGVSCYGNDSIALFPMLGHTHSRVHMPPTADEKQIDKINCIPAGITFPRIELPSTQ